MKITAGKLICAATFACATASIAFAQAAPDVLILVDGEKLIGHLESATAGGVVFKSDLAGEVKVDWTKIKELQSSGKFAVAKKGEVFGTHSDPSKIPQGTVAVADQKVVVTPASGNPETVAVADTPTVIPQDSFLHAFKHPRFSDYWSGAAGLGFAWVESTQKSETLTTALNLQRTVPAESWIDPRYRTTFTFNSAYGDTKSNGSSIETNIIHAGLEQDEYFSKRLFGFGDVSFDHNYAQDLSLQYTLGGGLGVVAYKDAKQELDFKGQIAYISQHFGSIYTNESVIEPGATLATETSVETTKAYTNNLVGAILGETYHRSMAHGMTFNEEIDVTPAFNKPSAWTANLIANLGVPISKRFNMTFGIVDAYLNNPPAGFEKNSFQFVTNITYKIN